MLLKQKILDRLAGGREALVFRRWHTPAFTPGQRLKTAAGPIEVGAVATVAPEDLSAADAEAAGFVTLDALIASFGPAGPTLYRAVLRPAAGAVPAGELAPEAAAALRRRLDRHDRAAGEAWTRASLALLSEQPASLARLAEGGGADRDLLRQRLRKLADLGLVTSDALGYRLSPNGLAFRRTEEPAPPPRTIHEP
ncbi:hypothetical protein [Zavarzinia sp.]|uniref:hypothetical protein n=1 Tax=Zavarzinia sp. TaxID=2027920 RepID=UPI003566B07F